MKIDEKKGLILKEMEKTVEILKSEENLENISKGIFILTKLSRIYDSALHDEWVEKISLLSLVVYETNDEYYFRLTRIKKYVTELKEKLLLKEANSLDEKDYKVKSLYTLGNFSIPKSKQEAENKEKTREELQEELDEIKKRSKKYGIR